MALQFCDQAHIQKKNFDVLLNDACNLFALNDVLHNTLLTNTYAACYCI